MNKQSRWALKPSTVVIASLFGLSLAGSAAADGTPAAKQATATTKQTTATTKQATATNDQRVVARQVRASQLIGKDVRNAQGEDLGHIKDLVLDVTSGRVHYVVLSFGGFLGLGDKLFAYPMRAFKPTADKDELILIVDKARLKDAPGFDNNAFPDWNAPGYRSQVDSYFGPTMSQPAQRNLRFVRASEVMGKDVNDPTGRDLGEIHDVVVNLANGDIRYAVLEFDQSWSLKEKLFAFPLRAFQVGTRWTDDLVLNVSKDTLNNVPGFAKADWPQRNINDPKWITDIDRYLIATVVVPLPSTTNDALFVKLDTNKDGILSSDEVKTDASVQANWKKMDADNNGRVSRSEFNAAYRK